MAVRVNGKEVGECNNINTNDDRGVNVHSNMLSEVTIDKLNDVVDFGLKDTDIGCYRGSSNEQGNDAKGEENLENDNDYDKDDNGQTGEEYWVDV